jgi:peptide/nickel transport system ATP-binding protein
LLDYLKIQDGKIIFNEKDFLSDNLKARSPDNLRAIQLIFQNPDESLNPSHTVEEILSQPLKLYFNLQDQELKKNISDLLQKVRLGDFYMQRYPRQLVWR